MRVTWRASALIIVGSTLVSGLLAAPSAAARASASIGLSPASGAPGSTVTIAWHGFDLCRSAVVVTWDGARLATGSVLPFGSVSATVPQATPGPHVITASCSGLRTYTASASFRVTGGSAAITTTTRPPSSTVEPTTTTPTTTTTITTPPSTLAPPPPTTGQQLAVDGTLTFDHASIRPGDPLTVSGAGCAPGAMVRLTSDSQPVGQVNADAAGAFHARIDFTTVQAGHREVVADCGIRLVGGVDEEVTTSSGATAPAVLVLVFFLLAGIGVLRWR